MLGIRALGEAALSSLAGATSPPPPPPNIDTWGAREASPVPIRARVQAAAFISIVAFQPGWPQNNVPVDDIPIHRWGTQARPLTRPFWQPRPTEQVIETPAVAAVPNIDQWATQARPPNRVHQPLRFIDQLVLFPLVQVSDWASTPPPPRRPIPPQRTVEQTVLFPTVTPADWATQTVPKFRTRGPVRVQVDFPFAPAAAPETITIDKWATDAAPRYAVQYRLRAPDGLVFVPPAAPDVTVEKWGTEGPRPYYAPARVQFTVQPFDPTPVTDAAPPVQPEESGIGGWLRAYDRMERRRREPDEEPEPPVTIQTGVIEVPPETPSAFDDSALRAELEELDKKIAQTRGREQDYSKFIRFTERQMVILRLLREADDDWLIM